MNVTASGKELIKIKFDINRETLLSCLMCYIVLNMCQAGFDAVFFARADYQDILKRRKDRTMEAIWRGSKSLGSSSQVYFLHLSMKLPLFSFSLLTKDVDRYVGKKSTPFAKY